MRGQAGLLVAWREGLDCKHRAFGEANHMFSDAAEDHSLESRESMSGEDDEVRVLHLCKLRNLDSCAAMNHMGAVGRAVVLGLVGLHHPFQ